MSTVASVALGVMVVVAWLGAIGLIRTRDVYGRLHHLGPIALLGPVALTFALFFELGYASPTTVRALLIALIMATTGPIITHATARAARLRARGTLDVRLEDAGEAR